MRMFLASAGGGWSWYLQLFWPMEKDDEGIFSRRRRVSGSAVQRESDLMGGFPSMKVQLAGSESRTEMLAEQKKKLSPYILDSFFNVTPTTEKYVKYYGDYMLDSGAFTMLQGNAGKVDIKAYVDRYADYINRHQVKKYFELDIDPIVGYDEVARIRNYLFEKTGVQPIPVWHKSRGIENFKQMCRNYDYVAIGGYVSREFQRNEIQYFPRLIRYAHQHGAKIHGLGFTALTWLPKCHFDSVDSTAWVSGNRFGHVYRFNGRTMTKIDRPPGKRVKNKECAINNFMEWVKFSKYADTHL